MFPDLANWYQMHGHFIKDVDEHAIYDDIGRLVETWQTDMRSSFWGWVAAEAIKELSSLSCLVDNHHDHHHCKDDNDHNNKGDNDK